MPSEDAEVDRRVRRRFNIGFKLKEVKYYHDKTQNITKTAKEFSLERKTVRDWVRNREKLVEAESLSAAF